MQYWRLIGVFAEVFNVPCDRSQDARNAAMVDEDNVVTPALVPNQYFPDAVTALTNQGDAVKAFGDNATFARKRAGAVTASRRTEANILLGLQVVTECRRTEANVFSGSQIQGNAAKNFRRYRSN